MEQIKLLKELLDSTERELAVIDGRRIRLVAMRDTYKEHLTYLAESTGSVQLGLEGVARATGQRRPPSDPLYKWTVPHRPSRTKGTIGMVTAVLNVLKEAKGEPMHVREILPRALAMGAITESKDPANVVDLVAFNLRRDGKPVEKVAAKTWRFIGDLDG